MKNTKNQTSDNSLARDSSPHRAVQWVSVDEDRAGQRIDNFLLTFLKGVPKSRIYRLVRKGEVRVNKGRIKPEYKLAVGDVVRVPPVRVSERASAPKPSEGLAVLLEKSVLYENEQMLVINKPPGLAVHGGSGIQLGLIESLRQIRPESRFLELVHRLDRETSGCIMVAKKRSSLRHLQQELREGRINKVYNALVGGQWSKRRQHVNMALIKNQLANGERIVKVAAAGSEGAKSSLTQYRILQRFEKATLVEAKPITGRTHQIRVHCQYAGHPIIGDDKYGQSEVDKHFRSLGLKRLFLHALKLEFTLPGQQGKTTVEAPLGEDLTAVFRRLEVLPE